MTIEKIKEDLRHAEEGAELEIAGEKLAGNIVKENWWRGQLSGIRLALQLLEEL